MSSKPLISIVLPVYNIPSLLLEKSINSILEQTLNNIEIIIVDDGSPNVDNINTCDDYARKYPQIKVIHKNNEGVSIARNVGIQYASAEWIAFVDPDDWISIDMLAVLYNVVKNTKDNMPDIIVCNCFVEYDNYRKINHFYPHEKSFKWDKETKRKTILEIFGKNKFYNPEEIGIGVPWAKLYRRDFIIENSLLFKPQLRRMQDNIFNLYAFYYAEEVVYVNKPLYHYRKFGSSTSNRYSPEVFNDFEKIFSETEVYLKTIGGDYELYQAYYSRIIQSFNSYFRFYYANDKNLIPYTVKKNHFIELINKYPYKTALKLIDVRYCDKSIYLLKILIQLHCFDLIYLIVKQKSLLIHTQNQ